MKSIYTLCFSLFVLNLCAQEETLFSNLETLGAFGGPFIEIGSINGEVGAYVGGGGAIIFDGFFFGGYGQGTSYPEAIINGADTNIKFGHGGLWMGYTQNPHKLTHFFTSLKIGWGKTRLRRNGETTNVDQIFVLTPELGLELNLTDFFKVNFAGGYRWVNGISKLPSLENSDFSSPVGIITFRFGGYSGDFDIDW